VKHFQVPFENGPLGVRVNSDDSVLLVIKSCIVGFDLPEKYSLIL
jgi:hypothetical protein